jgi:hypothetical protein
MGVVEAPQVAPFDIRRVYFIRDVPPGAGRGGHCHRALHQVYIAATGAVSVDIDDGRDRRAVRLDRPDRGLLLTPGIWRELSDFTADACLLVLASEPYQEEDYIRSYDEFRRIYGTPADQVP